MTKELLMEMFRDVKIWGYVSSDTKWKIRKYRKKKGLK